VSRRAKVQAEAAEQEPEKEPIPAGAEDAGVADDDEPTSTESRTQDETEAKPEPEVHDATKMFKVHRRLEHNGALHKPGTIVAESQFTRDQLKGLLASGTIKPHNPDEGALSETQADEAAAAALRAVLESGVKLSAKAQAAFVKGAKAFLADEAE